MQALPRLVRAALAALALLAAAGVPAAAEPLRVLILTGRLNHDWRATTPALKTILEGTGRFQVDAITHLTEITAARLAPYRVILSNWNTYDGHTELEQWPAEAKQAYLDFVRAGRGHVVVHAGGCSFYSWPEYQRMIGGASWKKGTSKFIAPGPPLSVRPGPADHPVTRGLSAFTTVDELYCRIGLADGVSVLAEGLAETGNRGDGRWHPVAAANSFGPGRNFILLLGHDVDAMKNPGFQTLLIRGTEWAGTGQVTLPVVSQAIEFPETVTPASLKKAEKAKQAAAARVAADAEFENALAAMGRYRRYEDRGALQAVGRLVARAGTDEALRARLAARFAAALAGATPDARGFLCEQLGLLGAVEAIPALAPWLLDQDTAGPALGALERMGGPEAATAVRQALARANDAQSVALMLAAGRMGDEAAVPEIQQRLAAGSPAATAAIQALGDIGSPAALAALVAFQAPRDLRDVHATALLSAALTCKSRGRTDAARPAFALLLSPSSPSHARRVALAEQFGSDGDKLRQALLGGDPDPRDAALAVLGRGDIPGGIALLVAALPQLPPDGQVQAIARVRVAGDATAIPTLKKLAVGPDAGVRREAYQALGRLGAETEAGFLLDCARNAPPEDLAALRDGLGALKNEAALPVLKAALANGTPTVAGLIAGQLAQRGDITAVPALLDRLATADRELGDALVAALGELGGTATLPALAALFGSPARATPGRVRSALADIARRQPTEAAAVLLGLWARAPAETRLQWVEVFGSVEDPSVLALLQSLLQSPDESLRSGAIRALGQWPDAQPYDLLLTAAGEAGGDKARMLALRSAAALLGRAADYDAGQFAAAVARGLAAAIRPEEKRLFITAATRRPSPEVAVLLRAHADDPEIQDDVRQALAKMPAPPAPHPPASLP